MPKISVIMPVYNAERYLRECMDSILSQTLSDFEMFCINDGSTDGTEAILAEYAATDVRVKLQTTNHVGAYKARREGLKQAVGEFVYFMDADDALKTKAFEELTELADRERLDEIVFTAELLVDGDKDVLERYVRHFTKSYALKDEVCGKVMRGVELFRKLVLSECYFPGPPMRITRRSVLTEKDYDFPEAPFHGDNYFTTVSLFNSERACALNTKYYRRRVRNDSITTSVGTEKIHFLSTMNVLCCLCAFKPLAEDACAAEPAAVRYLSKLHATLVRRAKALSPDVVRDLCRQATADSSSGVPSLFAAVSRLQAQALASRPSSVRGCLKYILGRLFGRPQADAPVGADAWFA